MNYGLRFNGCLAAAHQAYKIFWLLNFKISKFRLLHQKWMVYVSFRS